MPAGPIPILKLGSTLLATIQIELHDTVVDSFQNDVLEEIEKTGAKRPHRRHLRAGNGRQLRRAECWPTPAKWRSSWARNGDRGNAAGCRRDSGSHGLFHGRNQHRSFVGGRTCNFKPAGQGFRTVSRRS